MKRMITIVVMAVLMAAIISTGCGFAVRAQSQSVWKELKISGTMTTIKLFMDPSPKIEGTKMTSSSTCYLQVHGSLEGVVRIEGIGVTEMTNGIFTLDGVATFTGKLEDREGSFVFSVNSTGQFTSPTGDSGWSKYDSIVIRGMDGLEGLTGNMHFESTWSPTGETNSYSGTMKFEKK